MRSFFSNTFYDFQRCDTFNYGQNVYCDDRWRTFLDCPGTEGNNTSKNEDLKTFECLVENSR